MDQARLERLLDALHRTDEQTSVLLRLCTVCVQQVGVDGAALSTVVDGEPAVVQASDDEFARIAKLQTQVGEGPCYDALATAAVAGDAHLSSPSHPPRWPAFAAAAREHGVAAVFAFPLRRGSTTTGTFDMYNRRPGDLGPERSADASMLADLASLAIDGGLGELGIERVGIAVEPDAPWAHSAIVHNATGMLSARLEISVDDALLRLRALAFVQDRSVAELAREVVERRLHVESWNTDA